MASCSSSSARFLFSDSKRRLADRVSVNVNNGASVARQIVRGSKSSEVSFPIPQLDTAIELMFFRLQMMMQSAKQFANQESAIDRTMDALKKMELIRQHMGYQQDAIEENAKKLEYVKEQVHAMER